MPYLLDADVLSALLRNPNGPIAQRIAQVGLSAVCTSIIAASELRFGALKRGSAKLTADVEGLLIRLPVKSFETPADYRYAEIRATLEQAGTPIRGNDMLIAAHALALDCILVTGNEREFRRVKRLKIENWLR
jgi:tRNA(fMet)-specific endonuclease VapC